MNHEKRSEQPPAEKITNRGLGSLLRVAAEDPHTYFGTEIPDKMRDALRDAGTRLHEQKWSSVPAHEFALISYEAALRAHPDESPAYVLLKALVEEGAFGHALNAGTKQRILDEAKDYHEVWLRKALLAYAKR